jgi:Transcriptional regulators of sugar metabolism
MFIEERHQKIYDMLKEKGRVEVQDLRSVFQLSEDSIRRDLRIMEQKGLLSRTYGGAVLPDRINYCPPFSERMLMNGNNKSDIAALAAGYLRDGNTIFLDGSTTVAKMIPYLNQYKNLTVITNSILISYEILSKANDIHLLQLGGPIKRNDANALGINTVREIEQLHVDKVFSSPCAISAKGGLSCSEYEEIPVKKAILDAGREIYLLIESEKFGMDSLFRYAPIKFNYTIITDTDFTDDMYLDFEDQVNQGLKIIHS